MNSISRSRVTDVLEGCSEAQVQYHESDSIALTVLCKECDNTRGRLVCSSEEAFQGALLGSEKQCSCESESETSFGQRNNPRILQVLYSLA